MSGKPSANSDESIHYRSLVDVLCALLSDAHDKLQDAQEIISHCSACTGLSNSDFERLQNLDSATQLVDAVKTVLGNSSDNCIKECFGSAGLMMNVKDLVKDVKLHSVVEAISGKDKSKKQKGNGDLSGSVEMF
ncbi:hypothetical protein WSS15_31510 [Acetobacter pasteurianus]|uniref:Uncharacterized protein n=1 Tax=Acetobacter pasteurianus NBRC 3278 TaxID=1226660 RepID=A0A401X766_ACEPA|nr:hypothetical protein [Acetobacter pasteurianus]GCD63720.1 hypothetical protein NBRC3278_2813 [Acetobacter pasteurianus NBRC 3278]GCD70141.1 hypothetical protein NBRC3280_2776 [Acetobacter pasteurianus NBRC 3280]GLH30501.1 hypothetical protein WSS15_31510 [Acetobacter pasteurianus]